MKPIHKFNNGNGATLCNKCSCIITTGFSNELFCNKCLEMADITMCNGTDCPLKEKCYRYTAPRSELWQSMFMVVPYNKEENKCDHYWEVK